MQNTDSSFAAKLNHLFEEKRKPNGDRYSKKEVIESSPALSRLILWRLETGKTLKPSYEIVRALAHFFGVAPDYFFESSESESENGPAEVDQQEALQVALRNSGLDKDEQKAVLLMIEALKHAKR